MPGPVRSRASVLFVVTVLCCALPPVGAQPRYSFQEFRFLPGIKVQPTAIGSDGTIAGYYYLGRDIWDGARGFFLRYGRIESVELPGAHVTSILAFNSSHHFAAESRDALLDFAGFFLGDRNGSVTPIHLPYAYGSIGGINASGMIAATTWNDDGYQHPILIKDGAVTWLDSAPRGWNGAELTGINARGAVIGTWSDDDIRRSFVMQGAVATEIRVPGSSGGTRATGINDHNQVIGYHEGVDIVGNVIRYQRAFVYDRGTYVTVDFPVPPGPAGWPTGPDGCEDYALVSATPLGINNRGQILGEVTAVFTDDYADPDRPGTCILEDAAVRTRHFIATPST